MVSPLKATYEGISLFVICISAKAERWGFPFSFPPVLLQKNKQRKDKERAKKYVQVTKKKYILDGKALSTKY